MNTNKPTIEQLNICCRHVDELIKAKMSKNLAIRTLELVADLYAMTIAGDKAGVWNVNKVPHNQWSLAAVRAKKQKPNANAGSYLRVEHGTPRREFAGKIRGLYQMKCLNKKTMAHRVKKYWKIAVITHIEDAKLGRRKTFKNPQQRWYAAGIRFPKNSPNALKP